MKFKMTDEVTEYEGRTLHRIRCVDGFGDVAPGERGGWLEDEGNLSQDGLCWVYGDAKVLGQAQVQGDVPVRGAIAIGGKVVVGGNTDGPIVRNVTRIGGNARIGGDGVNGNGYLC